MAELTGILLDILKEKIARYRVRQEDIIYVHNLDYPVYKALRPEDLNKVISGYTLVGELVHSALPNVMQKAEQRCKTVWLPRWVQYKVDRRVGERFLHYQDSNIYVVLCGSPDGLLAEDGTLIPVEFKTTRRNDLRRVPQHWMRRPALYATLYNVSYGYLIILNLVRGEERDVKVKAYSEDKLQHIITKWLLGEWPQRTLPSYNY